MLDTKTLLIAITIVHAGLSIVMLAAWRRYYLSFDSLKYFVFDHILRTIGLSFMLCRGMIPDFFSIVVANTMLLSGFSVMALGFERFFHVRSSHVFQTAIVGVGAISFFIFTHLFPSLTTRTIILYGVSTIQGIFLYILLCRRIEKKHHSNTRPLAWIFMAFAILSFLRLPIALYERHEGDFFSMQSAGTMLLLGYLVIVVLTGLGVLMIIASTFLDNLAQHKRDLERTVEERTSQLVQQQKLASLGVLSAGVAHEINNPNNFILLNAESLAKGWNILRPHLSLSGTVELRGAKTMNPQVFADKMPEIIEDIRDGAQKIARIIDDLKGYAVPSGAEHEAVDFADAVNVALRLHTPFLLKHSTKLITDIGTGPLIVRGNLQHLEQMTANLLLNAAQSLTCPTQHITIKVYPELSVKPCACLEVRDEGCGIPEEIHHRLYEPFFTTRRSSGGTGLGLWVVNGIVEEHHGTIQFLPNGEQGTVVMVKIPLCQ
jgi:signal transduction histidine kinase